MNEDLKESKREAAAGYAKQKGGGGLKSPVYRNPERKLRLGRVWEHGYNGCNCPEKPGMFVHLPFLGYPDLHHSYGLDWPPLHLPTPLDPQEDTQGLHCVTKLIMALRLGRAPLGFY